MKHTQAIDLSDVKINPVHTGGNDIEAEVTTKHDVARLTVDFSSDKYVGLTVVLPSGNVYESKIDSWASDRVNDETDEGLDSIMRLSAGFAVQCFERETQQQN